MTDPYTLLQPRGTQRATEVLSNGPWRDAKGVDYVMEMDALLRSLNLYITNRAVCSHTILGARPPRYELGRDGGHDPWRCSMGLDGMGRRVSFDHALNLTGLGQYYVLSQPYIDLSNPASLLGDGERVPDGIAIAFLGVAPYYPTTGAFLAGAKSVIRDLIHEHDGWVEVQR